MLGEHHRLLLEFPEFKDRIHQLKTSNKHFAGLYQAYQDIDNEIYRLEENIEHASDQHLEELKKRRLHLKDQLYQILKAK